jgi:hypothetical protein
MVVEDSWNDTDGRKQKSLQENLSQGHFCTTNLSLEWPRINLGVRSDRPAISRLNYGTAS